MASYTVIAVAPNPRPWNATVGGAMLAYKVTLRDEAGQETAGVEWSRKEKSPAPVIGQVIEGLVDMDGRFGPKFKQQSTGGQTGGGRVRDPRETAAIQRQHSQEMGLRAMAVRVSCGESFTRDDFWGALKAAVDWFERDIADGVGLREGSGERPVA